MNAIVEDFRLPDLTVEAVNDSLGQHLGVYRYRAPHYQTEMLNNLLRLWQGHHDRLLDIGGGTGVIGQCIQDLFPVGEVHAVDVVDRFCSSLSIATEVYDGTMMPFDPAQFDAATINNVVHHIPVPARIPLFREIRRVVDGPLYIKDHVAVSRLDHGRLTLLDFIGNIPFGGMIKADYLSRADWEALAAASGYRVAATISGRYRHGAYAMLFPNRLETTMRWEPVQARCVS